MTIKDERPLPDFLRLDGASSAQALLPNEVDKPELGLYPTNAQLDVHPRESAIVISALHSQLSRDLNASIVREADLRDALAHAVAAMESAQHLSVLMARSENDTYDRAPSHMAIQNVLNLALFHINETTGINARGAA